MCVYSDCQCGSFSHTHCLYCRVVLLSHKIGHLDETKVSSYLKYTVGKTYHISSLNLVEKDEDQAECCLIR